MLTIDRAETVVVAQKRRKIVGEMTTAGEAQRRSERVPGPIEIEEVIETETDEADPMGLMQLAELSSLARFLCPHYLKLRQQRCGPESG